MKRTAVLLAIALMILFTGSSWAANDNGGGYGHRVGGFIDENGDGFNDRAPDADGDGIPNGLDCDFVRPQDGSWQGRGNCNGTCPYGKSGDAPGRGFDNGAGGRGNGPQTPGGGPFGSGDCDGTGPHGRTGNGRR